MQLITDLQCAEMLENGRRQAAGELSDPRPIVKLFTPDGAATWLLSELDPDDPRHRVRSLRPRPWLS